MPLLQRVPTNLEPMSMSVQSVRNLKYLCDLLANCNLVIFRGVPAQSLPTSTLNGRLRSEAVTSCSVPWFASNSLFCLGLSLFT